MSTLAQTGFGNGVALPVGAVSSLALHGALVAAAIWAITPPERAPQPVPHSEMSVEAYQVPRSEAAAAKPETEQARQDQASGESVEGGAVPLSRAAPAPLAPDIAAAAPPKAESAKAAAPASEQAAPALPPAEALASAPPPSAAVEAAKPPSQAAPEAQAAAEPLAAAAPLAEAAEAGTPTGDAARAAAPQAEGLREVPPPAELATASDPSPKLLAETAPARAELAAVPPPTSEAVKGAEPVAAPILASAAKPDPIAAAAVKAAPIAAAAVKPAAIAAEAARPETIAAAAPASGPALAPAPAEIAVAPRAEAPRETAPAAMAQPEAAASPAAKAAPAPAAEAERTAAASPAPVLDPAPATAPPAEHSKAVLAPIGPDGKLDPKSLDALAALTAPADPGSAAAEVQDGLLGVLGAIPCARIQMIFDPDTGEVVLRGNIPDAAQAEAITAGVVAQIGSGLPIKVDLRELPPPQCSVLGGLDAAGLPQSTEQITNDKILGAGGFALEQDYKGGEPLSLELQGADYPSYIYVDFYTADGQVLHLIPNTEIPLELVPAKARYDALRKKGERGPLGLQFGPPYGREIAVAYSSSVPLYDGLRPLMEPARDYLTFLQDRVAATKAATPDFKGEWVYFLITSHQ